MSRLIGWKSHTDWRIGMWTDNDDYEANLCESLGFDGNTDCPFDAGRTGFHAVLESFDSDWALTERTTW